MSSWCRTEYRSCKKARCESTNAEVPKWLKGLPWKGSRSLVAARIGHAPGGVCPFGINEGIEVYLDDSLKQFTTVYPAAGNDHSAVKLTIPELERAAGAKGWVDVTSRSTQTRSPQN